MRSLLFVPGDDERKLLRAPQFGADALIYDLEDSVAPNNKSKARNLVAEVLADRHGSGAIGRAFVRVNSIRSEYYEDDLSIVLRGRPDGIMIPKPDGPQDLWSVADTLDWLEPKVGLAPGSTRVLAIATETPAAVLALPAFGPGIPRLDGLAWGGEDLSAALGATANRDAAGAYTGPFQLARNFCLMAAAAGGYAAIDAVYTDFSDQGGLRQEALDAARDGFTGKMAIHPGQVATINEAFSPSSEEVQAATRIVRIFEASGETGVASLDGEMLDRPHLLRAQRVLERDRLARRVGR